MRTSAATRRPAAQPGARHGKMGGRAVLQARAAARVVRAVPLSLSLPNQTQHVGSHPATVALVPAQVVGQAAQGHRLSRSKPARSAAPLHHAAAGERRERKHRDRDRRTCGQEDESTTVSRDFDASRTIQNAARPTTILGNVLVIGSKAVDISQAAIEPDICCGYASLPEETRHGLI